jgi:hypothetical protein
VLALITIEAFEKNPAVLDSGVLISGLIYAGGAP